MSLCPFCQVRPIREHRGGKPRVHCGDPACRLARRRQTNKPSLDARSARRAAFRMFCRACAAPLLWTGQGRRPFYCQDATCRKRRAADRAYRYFLQYRCKWLRGPGRVVEAPIQPAVPQPSRSGLRETTAQVDARLAQVKQDRLARERAAGQRTFTVGDGWMQRAGRCAMDGEMRLCEVDGYE
jgi:hypothetical protein